MDKNKKEDFWLNLKKPYRISPVKLFLNIFNFKN
jgi:hypothetical protein